jgi:hypothetical protein
MPYFFTVEIRPGLHNLRKWIRRMLVGICRKRAQGFQFTDSIQPAADREAVVGTPLLDCECELRRPQEQRSNRCKERIQSRVEPFDQNNRLTDCL